MIEPQILVDEPPAEVVERPSLERRRLLARGIVQGVGFRPHVWRLATERGLTGSVRNTSGGVVIEAAGDPAALDSFTAAIRDQAPPLARIDSLDSETLPPLEGGMRGPSPAGGGMRGPSPAGGGMRGPVPAGGSFRIEESQAVDGQHQPLSPDAATCDDCLRELRDPRDRRHRHPFINCTSCGPRFTIIRDIPYDRPLTTMRRFAMCERCRAEYEDPGDRRFHAQPIACPDCGPRLWFSDPAGAEQPGDPIELAAAELRDGRTVAVKGLGGFQLACDATDPAAVARLRERKHRPAKPFAVMVRDLPAARCLCEIGAREEELLTSPARPAVLLRTRPGAGVAAGVAPHLDELGVMLPYTPVHHLLLEAVDRPLVMTSGNLSEEPIAKANDEALERLGPLADGLLLHDRDIYARYDDSVARVAAGEPRLVRRARGYCPVALDIGTPPGTALVAYGAHLKNTFCLVSGREAFVGPHIGDLEHPLSLEHQAEALETYLRLFRLDPRAVACDLHPDYASTRLAERAAPEAREPIRVQHHHAHIASVMAEHGLRGRLIGVALDGTGYGPDGTVWGGELLVCDERDYRRAGHLLPVPQPGGDLCAREGWRMALAYRSAAGVPAPAPPPPDAGGEAVDEQRWRLVGRVAESSLASLSSSAGRLFDAVASLLGVAHVSTYEAEAAMALESVARSAAGELEGVEPLPVPILEGETVRLDTPAMIRRLVHEQAAGRPAPELGAAFHEGLAQAVAGACARIAVRSRLDRVALSGGVFQNTLLLERTLALLGERGFEVHTNRLVPANDGGVSLGQALVAASTGWEESS